MVKATSDPKVDFVLNQIETMVGAEGGKLLDVDIQENSLSVKYVPGINEECPECVPSHDQVDVFLKTSLGIHAPHIKSVNVI